MGDAWVTRGSKLEFCTLVHTEDIRGEGFRELADSLPQMTDVLMASDRISGVG